MSKSITEIRETFLNFFHNKGHHIIPSSSLVPHQDPTLLFTNAGMNQFKNVFLGLDNYPYQRVTTSQRCVRVGGKHNDLENVGYTARHNTFFEMLGNFSFGDYFKYDAIQYSWELLTSQKWFNLPKEKLWVTVHITDDEAYKIWAHDIGVPTEHIVRIGDNKSYDYASDNFWKMDETGPCGPCSEIFYDHGAHVLGNPPGNNKEEGDRYIEIWNLVFMQFERKIDGKLILLPNPSVDTGMGLERITAVLQNVNSNYEIDLFKKLISATAQIIGVRDFCNKSLHVIADHIRSCAFLVSDGVIPSNEGRGYVLRRIIRRAIRHGNMMGVNNAFFYKLVSPLIEIMGNSASLLKIEQSKVEEILRLEEEQFASTLKRGLARLEKEITKITGHTMDGETAFRLYDTYGLPLDLTIDVCQERKLSVDTSGFKRAMTIQQRRSRKSNNFITHCNSNFFLNMSEKTRFLGYTTLTHQAQVIALFRDGKSVDIIRQNDESVVILDETPFYAESGGQVGDQGSLKSTSGMFFNVIDTKKYGKGFGHFGKINYGELRLGDRIIAQVDNARRGRISLNHSATHLLNAALRKVLGNHVKQKGSLVNDHCLRFDFSHNKAMSSEQVRLVENIVNEQIRKNLLIHTKNISLEEAFDIYPNKTAIARFSEQHDSQVREVSIGDFSIEFCCGTHVARTGNIGLFHITSESSIATGTRRIEAVTGEIAFCLLHSYSDLVHNISNILKTNEKNVVSKVLALQKNFHHLEKNLQELKKEIAYQEVKKLSNKARDINGVKIIISQVKNVEANMLRFIVNNLKEQLVSAVIVLAVVKKDKINLIIGVTQNMTHKVAANNIASHLAQQLDGKGGGHSELAQMSGNITGSVQSVLLKLDAMLISKF